VRARLGATRRTATAARRLSATGTRPVREEYDDVIKGMIELTSATSSADNRCESRATGGAGCDVAAGDQIK
jgi:hypothetical protein